MATLDFPNITPDGESWTLTYNTQSFTSDLNGAMQTAELPGARWSVSLTFGNRQDSSARTLKGFVSSLRGRAGRFWVTPSDWEPLGNPSGTGVLASDATSGTSSIDTSGWDVSVTSLFEIGDYFELGGELKQVTSPASSDASGLATIEFAPPLRVGQTSGTQIRYNEPRCRMMLANDDMATFQLSAPVIYAITFDAVEALDI